MKRFLEELRGARRIELFLAIAAIAVLLLVQMRNETISVCRTEQELRLIAILNSIEGVGQVDAMISEGEPPGVLIVAEGADEMSVMLRLQYAVQTLLGVEASRVEIVPHGS